MMFKQTITLCLLLLVSLSTLSADVSGIFLEPHVISCETLSSDDWDDDSFILAVDLVVADTVNNQELSDLLQFEYLAERVGSGNRGPPVLG